MIKKWSEAEEWSVLADCGVYALHSACAMTVKRMDLTIHVYGEKGGIHWEQEQPNQLYWTSVSDATLILEGEAVGLSPGAQSCRD